MNSKRCVSTVLTTILACALILTGCGPSESTRTAEKKKSSTGAGEQERPPESTETPRSSTSDSVFENVQKKYGVSPNVDNWSLSRWRNSDPLTLKELNGQVVVIRFWTNTCPYCARSMPALQRLSTTFQGDPVTFIGAYHSKPYGSERPWSKAVELTENWGVTFPVAYDRNWSTLKSWWLSSGNRRATSCTFVLNTRGKVTYIHPGPVYAPGDPNESKAARDYRNLKKAIRHTLP